MIFLLKCLHTIIDNIFYIILKNISLSIKQGQTIGTVGEFGSGKSTIGKAIL